MTNRVEWVGADGQHHSMSIAAAAKMLKEFDDEWPGGVAEVEAALAMGERSLAEVKHKFDMYKTAYDEWHEKTDWVQATCHWSELGMHRADVLKKRLSDAEHRYTVAAIAKCREAFLPMSVSYKCLTEMLQTAEEEYANNIR